MTNTQKHLRTLLLSAAACLSLAACSTTGSTTGTSGDYDREAKIDSALDRAANSAALQGETNQSLGYLERLYKRNSNDPVTATSYAKALREADYLNRASAVLAPFANAPEGPAEAKAEFSAIELAMGNHKSAERYAQQAVLMDDTNFKAYQYLGIALESQGNHPAAEKAFRKSLELWQGDPTSIMNNLALNLAAQGFLDEASEILQKAKTISPDRIEIERNLRIVTALQQSESRSYTPKPQSKPGS
jgi:Flp pilus assembly protein TadD